MLGNRSVEKYDIIVVGGGIVGAACAWELSRANQKVLVLCDTGLSNESTAAGMGHILVLDDSEAQFNLTSHSRALWEKLLPKLPEECEDDPCGTLWVAEDDEEMEVAEKRYRLYVDRGIKAEVVGKNKLRDLEPNLRRDLRGGLHVPEDRVLYHPNCVKWFLRNVEVKTDFHVTRIAGNAVSDGTRTYSASAVVLAGGMRSRELVPGLPLFAKKGHLVITDRYPGFCSHQIVELGYLKSAHGPQKESVAFNLQPRITGQYIIGSSREVSKTDKNINRTLLGRMLSRACNYMPGLSDLRALRTWVGVRPSTPDNLPLIGSWPEIPGLYVAAGHEGLGITTCLSTAHLIASSVLNRSSELDPSPYSAERVMKKEAA